MCEEGIIPPHPSRDSGGEYLLMTLIEKKKREGNATFEAQQNEFYNREGERSREGTLPK